METPIKAEVSNVDTHVEMLQSQETIKLFIFNALQNIKAHPKPSKIKQETKPLLIYRRSSRSSRAKVGISSSSFGVFLCSTEAG